MDIKKQWAKYYTALKKQDWSKALAALSSIKEQRPRDSQVHIKIGDILQRMEDSRGAVDSYHKAAVYLVKEGFLQKAVAIFKIILRLDPRNKEATMKLGKVLEVAASSKRGFLPLAAAKETEAPADIEPMTPGKDITKPDQIPQPTEPVKPEETPAYGEVPSYGEISVPEKEPERETPEVPSHGEITLPGSGEEPTGEPGAERELGPGYGEITLDENEVSGDGESLKVPEMPDPKKEEDKEAERGPGTVFGEIPIEEKEVSGAEEGLELPEMPDPEKEKDEEFDTLEDFNELLSEAAKELPDFKEDLKLPVGFPAIFLPLGEMKARMIVERAKARTFKSGERIINEGDTGDSLFFIIKGAAKVVSNILGMELVLATLTTGDIFGEVTFITGRPRTASIVAEGDNEILEFNRQLLEEAISKNPEVLENLNDLYYSRVSDTMKKVSGN
jgi:tetratricopeptide (TPR) repeat protein